MQRNARVWYRGEVANFRKGKHLLCDGASRIEAMLACEVYLYGDISIGREHQEVVVGQTLLVPRSFPFPGWSFAARTS